MGPCQKSSDLGCIGRLNYMGHAPMPRRSQCTSQSCTIALSLARTLRTKLHHTWQGVVGPGCEGCEPFLLIIEAQATQLLMPQTTFNMPCLRTFTIGNHTISGDAHFHTPYYKRTGPCDPAKIHMPHAAILWITSPTETVWDP